MASRVTAEQRRRMIAEAAYFRAQRRGFRGGDPVDDWLAAEAEVEHALALLEDAGPLSITQEELDHLMARAREAQLELRAESQKMRQQARPDERPSDSQLPDGTWEALSAEMRSIAPDRK
jgi:DUF2934 family protein